MRNTILDLFDVLLSHPDSQTSPNINGDKYVRNSILNCCLELYSDEENNYYFKFYYLKDKDGHFLNEKFTIYKTDDQKVGLSVWNKLINHYNVIENKKHPENQKYITLFKKILKQEKIPEKYNVKFTKHKIELREDNVRSVTYLERSSIEEVILKAESSKIPTDLFFLGIHGIPNYTSRVIPYIWIPKYEIKDYSLLLPNPIQKQEKNITTSIDDWIKTIKKIKNIPDNGLSDVFNYVELQRKIPEKEIDNTNKLNKFKI